jgi:hypothetical protein
MVLHIKNTIHTKPIWILPIWILTGIIALLVSLLTLRAISPAFGYDIHWEERPTSIAVGLMIIAASGYFLILFGLFKGQKKTQQINTLNTTCFPGPQSKTTGHPLVSYKALLIFGLLIRLLWFGSTPIYEDDYYRYFFDGQMVTNGLNPYTYAPADALPPILPAAIETPLSSPNNAADNNNDQVLLHEQNLETPKAPEAIAPTGNSAQKPEQFPAIPTIPTIPPTLKEIAQSGPVDRVAYPYIRTIYPPITQAVFALSQWITPWGLDTWRGILLLADIICLYLLCRILKRLERPRQQVMIYWLNPLLITEIMNAGHMDILLLPFLLAGVLFFTHKRLKTAGTMLALAVGVKIWPLILSPFFFLKHIRKYKDIKALFAVAAPFIILSFLFLLPQIATKLDGDAGLIAYSENWQVNAFLFSLIDAAVEFIQEDSIHASRIIVAVLFLLLGGYQFVKSLKNQSLMSHGNKSDHTEDSLFLTRAILMVTVSLFLLSPTGYPWYYIWLLPWLAVHPSRPLLLLSITLPLYDLRYPLTLIDGGDNLFNTWVVPLEFAPALLWIMIDFAKSRRQRLASHIDPHPPTTGYSKNAETQAIVQAVANTPVETPLPPIPPQKEGQT